MIAFTYYLKDARPRREAESLVRRGDEVDFICCREPGQVVMREYNGVRLFALPVARYRGDRTLRYLLTYMAFFVRAFCLISILHLRRRYKIIQVHTMPDFLVFATVVPKLLGAKIILDVHDLVPELYMSKFGVDKNCRLIKFLMWIERRSIAFADKAIAVSIPHRNALVAHGNPKDRFTVILNLPDPDIFGRAKSTERSADGKLRLIFHGILAQRQGLDVAIRAVAIARNVIPNLEFTIIGDGDDRERLVGMVNDMGLTGCIKFSEGALPVEEIPFRIKQADIGLVPMLDDTFTSHGLPVKLLEYVGCGIPVIVSRTSAVQYYFDETMIRYVQPGDDVELANGIVDLCQAPQKRASLIQNSKKFNVEFNWNNHKIVYYGLVDSLLTPSSHDAGTPLSGVGRG
jgi:glycosyltransferase involved in cell wall biosynthesis